MHSVEGPESPGSHVDLYWLPLGAGGHSVRWNGRIFEALIAAREHRPRRDLYHSALTVTSPAGRFVIELAPVPDARGASRGVVAEGSVGTRWAGRFRWFRYELRRWPDGVIPDVAEAVQSPRTITTDEYAAERILQLVPQVPVLVWGRDERRTGEMWNSNSVISWLLERAGLDAQRIELPDRGRAPGWTAGLVLAHRQASRERQPR